MAREVRLSMRVWDAPTRLFHWAVVILVALAYASWRLDWMQTHVIAGDVLLALLIFRLGWGLAGSDTSRFRHLFASPAAVLHDLIHGAGSGPDNRVGYGPASGWMVLELLLLLSAQTVTGLFASGADGSGPLAGTVAPAMRASLADWHTWLWDALIVSILLHLLAVVIDTGFRGRTQIGPMVTGRKRLPGRTRPPRMASGLLALAILVLAGVVTWVVVWLVPRLV